MRRLSRALPLVALLFAGGCANTASQHGAHGVQSAATQAAVCDAYARQARRVEVDVRGSVVELLGVRSGPGGVHEGFLVALAPGSGCAITLRVEHNVDLAGRVPLRRGEPVELRGEYIYDPRGGLLHWTHHDPAGRHPGGYLRAGGELYQ
jgi:hypothetical protein